MLKLSRDLITELNTNNIRYCHWKSNEHLMPGLAGDTDLDILVNMHDMEKCRQIYKSIGLLSVNSQYGSSYPDVEDWIGMDSETGKLIHVHQHYEVVTGHQGLKEFTLPWSKIMLDTRVIDPTTEMYITDPRMELYILYTRLVLKCSSASKEKAEDGKFELNEDIKKEIDYLKKQCTYEECRKFYSDHVHCSEKMAEYIWLEHLSSRDFLQIYAIVADENKQFSRYGGASLILLKKYYPFAIRGRNFLRKRLNMSIIYKKTFQKKGAIIAFIGQDGSGKSTITSDLESWLKWKIDAKRYYLGSGDYYNPWQKRLLKIIGMRKENNKVLKMLSGLITISFCTAASKKAYKETKKAYEYSNKGGIALFDRYPQGQFSGIYDGPKIRDLHLPKVKSKIMQGTVLWFAKREEGFIEKIQLFSPTIVFKLQLSVEESMRRKPENKYEDIVRKNAITTKLQFDKSEVEIIDAEDDYAHEILAIKNKLWDMLIGINN